MGKQNLLVQVNLAAFEYGLPGVEGRRSYTQALRNEISAASDYSADYAIEALYITGTNPLLYPTETLVEIIDDLRNIFSFLPKPEMTIYALPGSVTYGNLKTLHEHGGNRITFDMRTFVQSELDAINRTYAPRSIEVFMRMIQLKMIFFNYDVTLYYGLPGQTMESLIFSIEQAIRFMAAHITLLPYQENQHDDHALYYREAVKTISSFEFEQYTPLHFARPGYTSIWDQLSYSPIPRLGFGADAISQIDGMVIQNVNDVQAYIAADGDPSTTIQNVEPLSQKKYEYSQILHNLFNFRECIINPSNHELLKQIEPCIESGLLSIKEQGINLTEKGKTNWHLIVKYLNA